jgi:hypothetical protein
MSGIIVGYIAKTVHDPEVKRILFGHFDRLAADHVSGLEGISYIVVFRFVCFQQVGHHIILSIDTSRKKQTSKKSVYFSHNTFMILIVVLET